MQVKQAKNMINVTIYGSWQIFKKYSVIFSFFSIVNSKYVNKTRRI